MSDTFEVVYSPWYNAELAGLPLELQARIEKRLDHFIGKGWHAAIHDRPIAPLRDGIYEVRVLGTGPAFRILFFIVPGRSPRIVVLTACVAKSETTKRGRLDAQLERAKQRRATWLEGLRKRDDDDRR